MLSTRVARRGRDRDLTELADRRADDIRTIRDGVNFVKIDDR